MFSKFAFGKCDFWRSADSGDWFEPVEVSLTDQQILTMS